VCQIFWTTLYTLRSVVIVTLPSRRTSSGPEYPVVPSGVCPAAAADAVVNVARPTTSLRQEAATSLTVVAQKPIKHRHSEDYYQHADEGAQRTEHLDHLHRHTCIYISRSPCHNSRLQQKIVMYGVSPPQKKVSQLPNNH